MTQQQRRSSSDDDSNNDHPHTRAEGKSGGNAGAGKPGPNGLGPKRRSTTSVSAAKNLKIRTIEP